MPGRASATRSRSRAALVADQPVERIGSANRPSASSTRAAIVVRAPAPVDAHDPAAARGEPVLVGGDQVAVQLEQLPLDVVGCCRGAALGRLAAATASTTVAIGPQPARPDLVDGAHGLAPEPAHHALVDQRAVAKRSAITVAPRASAGAITSTSCARAAPKAPSARAPERRGECRARSRARARPPTSHRARAPRRPRPPALAQRGRQKARLRGLARPVDTLEGDEAGCHAWCPPCRWEDDSRTAQEPESAWRNVSLLCLLHLLTSSTGTVTGCVSSHASSPSGCSSRRSSRSSSGSSGDQAPGRSSAASAGTHGGAANAVVVKHVRGDTARCRDARCHQAGRGARAPQSTSPPSRFRRTRRSRSWCSTPTGSTASAHRLAAQVQGFGYPITYVGNAQRRGLPTIVQYAKGYGPAARKLAQAARQRAVRDAARRHHAGAGRASAKLVIILGT